MRVCPLPLWRAASRRWFAPALCAWAVFSQAAAGAPPVVSRVPNLVTAEDTPAMAAPIRIEAPDASAVSLSIRSSNPALAPESSAILSGIGAERVLLVTPAPNESGEAVLELCAGDGTSSVTQSFTVTVTAVNDTPTMSRIPDQVIPEGAPAPVISFSIGDVETPAASLAVTCTSLDPELIASEGMRLAGAGPRRTITAKARAGKSGTARVRVSVSDGEASASQEFSMAIGNVNRAPLVNAGQDQTLFLTNATHLNGSATDEEAGNVSASWSVVSGPASVEFANANAFNTTARFAAPGLYTLRLTAFDGALSASDDVCIIVGQRMARTEGKGRKSR